MSDYRLAFLRFCYTYTLPVVLTRLHISPYRVYLRVYLKKETHFALNYRGGGGGGGGGGEGGGMGGVDAYRHQ